MNFTATTKAERRWGLTAAIVATVVVTGSLSAMAAAKRSGENVSGEMLAKAALAEATQVHSSPDSEIQMFKLTIEPGGSGGWHSHPGHVIVTVTQGTATFYEAAGTSCVRKTYKTGEAAVEAPGVVHVTRNETKRDLVIHGVNIRPKGTKPGVWEFRPRDCHH